MIKNFKNSNIGKRHIYRPLKSAQLLAKMFIEEQKEQMRNPLSIEKAYKEINIFFKTVKVRKFEKEKTFIIYGKLYRKWIKNRKKMEKLIKISYDEIKYSDNYN